MSTQGTLEKIARHLALAMKPLRASLEDVDSFRGFMLSLGWDATTMPPDFVNLLTQIDQVVQSIDALSSNPDIEDVLDLIEDVQQLYLAIKNISTAPLGVNPVDFFQEIFTRIFEFLLINYVQIYWAETYYWLSILGIIKIEHVAATLTRPRYSRRRFHFQTVKDIIQDPLIVPQLVYGWGTADFKYTLFLSNLYQVFRSMGIHCSISYRDPGLAAAYNLVTDDDESGSEEYLSIAVASAVISGVPVVLNIGIFSFKPNDGSLPGIIIMPVIPSAFGTTFNFSPSLSLQLKANTNVSFLLGIILKPEGIEVKYPFQPGNTLPQVGFGATVSYAPEDSLILLGNPGKSRLEFGGADLTLDLNYVAGSDIEVFVDLDLNGTKIVLKGGDGDGFLAKILGDQEQVFDLDFGIRWSSLSGFHFKGGGGGFEVALNPHIELGPLRIEQLKLAIKAMLSTPGIEVKATADLGLELGPFTAVAEDLGVSLKLQFQEGNAGPFDIRVGFKPPMGIGLSIDASAFKGGGYLFFDYENESYAGVLELTIKETISVKAIGLLTTRFPDGSKGFSLLLMITAEFTPIQLGFGFTLNGVGGMIGINRTMVLSALRDGVKSGSINNIMFPTDPVANATQIISDLKTIFPPQEGRFAFGPMGKIGWGTPTLITMDVGLFIELPAPVRLAIIGIIRMLLPDENKQLLKLQVAFVGTIDFEQKFITFDASIFDSRLLTFTLEGDMAVRIKWGENSNFVFTVGGFHPQYVPPPLQLPTLKRLTINLLGGDNPRLTIQTYFAVTSNTVQFGSRVDFYFKVTGKCKVLGWLGFDALFQFSPFYFNVSFSAGLAVYWKNDPFLSISLTVMLEGPTPWHAKGTAEFKILVFKFKVNFDKTWGQQATTTLPDKAVFAEVKAAIEHRANWLATKSGTTDPLVTLRAIDTSNPNKLLITPDGGLSVSQKVVPMDVTISKFGNQKPSDYNLFHLDLLDGYGNLYVREDVKEEFAPNSFFNLNNSEKLSRPNFERYNGGLKGKAQTEAITSSLFQERDVEYEQILMDNRFTPPLPLGMGTIAAASFGVWTKNGSASNSAFGTKVKGESLLRPPKVSVVDKGYSVVDLDAGGVYQSNHAVTFEEAHQKLQEALRVCPELEGQLQILPSHEIA